MKVPDVVGLTDHEARSKLFEAGFEVGYGPEQETDRFAPGTVAAQSPEGGKMAKKGTQVRLNLAKAPPPPPTPTPTPSPSPLETSLTGGGADGAGGGGQANNPPETPVP